VAMSNARYTFRCCLSSMSDVKESDGQASARRRKDKKLGKAWGDKRRLKLAAPSRSL
jgi:hypothetical protein